MRDFLAGGLALLLFLGGPLSVLTPMPLAHMAVTRGQFRRAAELAGLLAAGVVLLFLVPSQAPAGLINFLKVSLPGFALKETHGLFLSLTGSLVYLGWLLTLGVVIVSSKLPRALESRVALWMGGSVIVWIAPAGMGISAYFTAAIHDMMEQVVAADSGNGIQAEQLDLLRANRSMIEAGLVRMMPAMLLCGMLGILWANTVLLRVWARMDQIPSALAPSHPLVRPLSLWRVPDPLTWLVIAAGALFFANVYLLQIQALRWILLNAFVVLAMIYFLHGLGIVSFFLRRRLAPIARGLVFGLIFIFFQTLGLVVVSLGFFDLWLDFRRLQTKNAPP